VVDYSLFTPHQPLKDNLIWIAEQLPGYIQSADVTSYIRNGYTRSLFPSRILSVGLIGFHCKAFGLAIIFLSSNMSIISLGTQQSSRDLVHTCTQQPLPHTYLTNKNTTGDYLTYDLSPRAQIFRRDANNATTLDEYLAFLRSNNWQNDPLSDGNPANQISARRDLVPTGPPPPNPFITRAAFGGIDSKATSSLLVKMGVSLAQRYNSLSISPSLSISIRSRSLSHFLSSLFLSLSSHTFSPWCL